MALFAITLKGKNFVSDGKSPLSSWPLHNVMEDLYMALRTGFENPGSLRRDQMILLTVIGNILRNFAFVELHPSPYFTDDTRLHPLTFVEYGLAPHDMELGDRLIPCDETKLRYFSNEYESRPRRVDMTYAWVFLDGCHGGHQFEVSMCLQPTSPKQVYEVSEVFQSKSSSLLDKIAAMVSSSESTYRDLQENQEFSYPPSQVRTARFLGPAYCVSAYRTHRWDWKDSDDYDVFFELEERLVNRLWEDYVDARAAGFCRPLNIDLV
ncbi:hypothetical protein K456DRAFT_1719557 [Colletotrichum gloeosporioides 23]|nr:hypothetical protein K456DRAFT_1719557 [Colletotrichum gloeosporioides 23]